jgi:hypothetical protein
MSVAQVLNVSGAPLTPGTPTPPQAQAGIDAIKALDGLEHIYTLGNADGQGLTIVVWRDKAAMEAGADEQLKRRQEVQATGSTITTTAVYENFAEL